jgi:hypothetical protein
MGTAARAPTIVISARTPAPRAGPEGRRARGFGRGRGPIRGTNKAKEAATARAESGLTRRIGRWAAARRGFVCVWGEVRGARGEGGRLVGAWRGTQWRRREAVEGRTLWREKRCLFITNYLNGSDFGPRAPEPILTSKWRVLILRSLFSLSRRASTLPPPLTLLILADPLLRSPGEPLARSLRDAAVTGP